MANGNTYPCEISTPDGSIARITGDIIFTDSTNQPQGVGVAGSQVVHGPYALAFGASTALAAGVAFGYTPAVGDLFCPIIVTTTAWNGTTPHVDVGFTGDTDGYFYNVSGKKTAGLALNVALNLTAFNNSANVTIDGTTPLISVPAWAYATAADALLVWVSQEGTLGGTAVAGSAGASKLYIISVTPVGF